MIRLVVLAIGLTVLAWIVVRLLRDLARMKIDWTGVVIACSFVAMAFYLRHVTGMG